MAGMEPGIDVAAATAHICRRIIEAQVVREPWPHLVIEDFLPDEAFARLLAAIPEDWLRTDVDGPRTWVTPLGDGIMGYKKGSKTRSWDRRRGALEVLADVFRAINSDREIFNALKKPLWRELRAGLARFQERYETALKVVQLTRLTKDGAAYQLKPHTDVPSKLVSIIHYVRCDPGAKLGTILYQPKRPQVRCIGETYHNFDRFTEFAMVPFKPNSALIFVRDDQTFHGVRFEPGVGDFARITVQSNFWMSDPDRRPKPRAKWDGGSTSSQAVQWPEND